MEPEQAPQADSPNRFENLKKITPLSKYLAMALFVILPFLGGYVGYVYAPEKVVEVERVVKIEVEKEVSQDDVIEYINKVGFFGRYRTFSEESQSYSYETDYLVIGTRLYHMWGAAPDNNGQFGLVQIPEADTNLQNFSVKTYPFSKSSCSSAEGTFPITLLVVHGKVYHGHTLLEGLDPEEMIVDTKGYNVRDKDTVYLLNYGMPAPSFTEGSLGDIGDYEPSCL